MEKPGNCAICGLQSKGSVRIMGNEICSICQTLLDDPRKKVFPDASEAIPMEKVHLLAGNKL
jgi:hypothetical protein